MTRSIGQVEIGGELVPEAVSVSVSDTGAVVFLHVADEEGESPYAAIMTPEQTSELARLLQTAAMASKGFAVR